MNHDGDPLDDNVHGTHVAGIIGAVTNNGVGIAGLAQVSIMAEKVLDSSGTGTRFDVAEGVVDAANKGARVTNNNCGPYSSDIEVMRAAFRYAWKRGNIDGFGLHGPAVLRHHRRRQHCQVLVAL